MSHSVRFLIIALATASVGIMLIVGIASLSSSASLSNRFDEYAWDHRNDFHPCSKRDRESCPIPADECQRLTCAKSSSSSDPICLHTADTSKEGDICDDDDPLTSGTFCMDGVCTAPTPAPTQSPTTSPTQSPTPAPTPGI